MDKLIQESINSWLSEKRIVLQEEGDVNVQVGRHNDIPDEEFNQEQLKMGIEVEMEHVRDEYRGTKLGYEMAKAIAKDHLSEEGAGDSYYTYLKEDEEEMKSKIEEN